MKYLQHLKGAIAPLLVCSYTIPHFHLLHYSTIHRETEVGDHAESIKQTPKFSVGEFLKDMFEVGYWYRTPNVDWSLAAITLMLAYMLHYSMHLHSSAMKRELGVK